MIEDASFGSWKILKVGVKELIEHTGSKGICDYCGNRGGVKRSASYGYYIAALNKWYCPTCYQGYIERSKKATTDELQVELEKERYVRFLKRLTDDNLH